MFILSLSRIIGGLLVLVGVVWMLQGAGVIGGSFMTGSLTWLVIGLVVGAVGTALLIPWHKRHQPRHKRPPRVTPPSGG